MITIFCLTTLLYAEEDVLEFDNVQELIQWYNQNQQIENADQEYSEEDDDMVIIKINSDQKIDNTSKLQPTSESIIDEPENSIESLPDATIVEVTEEPIKEESIVTEEEFVEINEENLDIKSLPDATVVANEDLKTVNKATVVENDQNESKPITIVKYEENPSANTTCKSAVKEEIDFWRLLDLAMIKSTKLIMKKHDIKITQKNMDIVKSEYYPNLTLGYSGEYYHGFGSGDASISGSYYPSYSQYRDSIDLSVSHELYRFGATDLKMQMSQKDIEIVKSELALVEEDISQQLLEYYVQAVRSQISLEFKDDMRLVQDRIIQKKWRLFEAGQIAKTIILRDKLSLVTLEKEILNHEMSFIDAIKKIQLLTNIQLDPKSVKFTIPTPKNSKIKTFEESATAKNLKLKLEKKLQELDLIKKDYKPTIYANSGFRLYGADEDSFTKTIKNLEKNSWDVGVSLRWELFSGFKTDSSVEKAKIEVQKLVEQYRLAKIDFESQEAKRESLKLAIDKILRVESEILDQTCQQEDLFVKLESAGEVSSIEIDNIELSKLASELNFRVSVIDKVYESISSELIR